jgi:hypothetical protein
MGEIAATGNLLASTSQMCAQKKDFLQEKTELTEIKKLKRNSQSLPSLLALFSPVSLFGCCSSAL